MRKLNLLFMVVAGVLMSAMTVFAQAPEAAVDHNAGFKAIAAGVGFAIQTMMILGLALIESLVLFALLVVFTQVWK